LTYIATINAIVLTGLEPVFVDVEPNNFSILPQKIEGHLESVNDSENYSIILPVHLMGYPCDMDEINRIAKEHDLIVFEDSAQAHSGIPIGITLQILLMATEPLRKRHLTN
jgi:dTDP-4-amino-4,6-dideoxygalactose transaminase